MSDSAPPELRAPAMASKPKVVLEAPVVTSIPSADRARLDDLRHHLDSCELGFQKCAHCHFAAGPGCRSSEQLSLVVLQVSIASRFEGLRPSLFLFPL